MNTIKAGKLFCKRYNKENNLNLRSKQIFLDVIVPLLFKIHNKECRYLINWTNLKFFNFAKEFKKFKEEEYTDKFKYYVDEFCKKVEYDENNVMTNLNVFGGCAIPEIDQTTIFSYSDNLYFDIEERYCSFIGSAFMLQCDGWNIVVNNERIIWDLYEGIKKYRNVIDNNANLNDKQLPAWNSAYLFEKYNGNVDNIVNEYFKSKGKLEINDKINFANFLFLLQKIDENIKYIELGRYGQTNITCGVVSIDVEYTKRQSKFFKQLYNDMEIDFKYFDYNKLFGGNLIYKAISNGMVYNGFFNPLKENDKNDKKIILNKLKYLDLIMKQEEKELAVSFANVLKETKNKSKININETDFFKERKVSNLIDKINNLPKNDIFANVIEHIVDSDKESLERFLSYTSFKFKYNN